MTMYETVYVFVDMLHKEPRHVHKKQTNMEIWLFCTEVTMMVRRSCTDAYYIYKYTTF